MDYSRREIRLKYNSITWVAVMVPKVESDINEDKKQNIKIHTAEDEFGRSHQSYQKDIHDYFID